MIYLFNLLNQSILTFLITSEEYSPYKNYFLFQ